MTREQNFRTTFIPQLAAYSSWQNIPLTDGKKIPTSLFPAFSIELGTTKYLAFDLAGKATAGEQEFLLTVYYSLPLREGETAYLDHSDILNVAEGFINTPVYIPPPVLPG